MKNVLTLSLVFVLAALKPVSGSEPRFDPLKKGPYPVGVTTALFVDHSRTDSSTQEPRTLVTEIWYPATDDARSLPNSLYTDFLPGGVTPEVEQMVRAVYKKPSNELNKLYVTDSHRDARVRSGKFPLILFSHGNGGNRHQNTFWCDFLASHGYIIVAPDHTGNSSMTLLPGHPMLYQTTLRNLSATDRPKDMIFLLNQMTLWNGGADSRFAGRMDLNAVCASGMSFGGMTAVNLADMDKRFKTLIAMSGTAFNHTNLTIPSLWMIGDEDTTIGAVGNDLIRSHHGMQQGPSFLLELIDGGHFSFTDMGKIDPNFGDGIGKGTRRKTKEPFNFLPLDETFRIVNACSLAFLEIYLRDRKELLPYLEQNHWPKEIRWNYKKLAEKQPAK